MGRIKVPILPTVADVTALLVRLSNGEEAALDALPSGPPRCCRSPTTPGGCEGRLRPIGAVHLRWSTSVDVVPALSSL
jgi:hypothetical protein